jgi:hypothetical protein
MQRPNRRTLLKAGWSITSMAGLPSVAAAVEVLTSPYNRPKPKITEIRTAEVRVHGYQVHIRVYTDQGIVSQGETTDASAGNVPLIRSFARMLIGRTAQYRRRLRTDPHGGCLRRRAGRPVRDSAPGSTGLSFSASRYCVIAFVRSPCCPSSPAMIMCISAESGATIIMLSRLWYII